MCYSIKYVHVVRCRLPYKLTITRPSAPLFELCTPYAARDALQYGIVCSCTLKRVRCSFRCVQYCKGCSPCAISRTVVESSVISVPHAKMQELQYVRQDARAHTYCAVPSLAVCVQYWPDLWPLPICIFSQHAHTRALARRGFWLCLAPSPLAHLALVIHHGRRQLDARLVPDAWLARISPLAHTLGTTPHYAALTYPALEVGTQGRHSRWALKVGQHPSAIERHRPCSSRGTLLR